MIQRMMQVMCVVALCVVAVALAAEPAGTPASASAPASKPASQPAANKWSGPVERTMSNVPRLVVGENHYRLKASPSATAAVKDALAKIGKGELTGNYEVTGTVDNSEAPKVWIVVETIRKAGS